MRSLALLALLGVLGAGPLVAQAPAERVRLSGMTLDHWRGTSIAHLRPTLRLTSYSRRGPGADLALVIFPDGISFSPPALVLGLQAGLAQPVPLGPATLLLKGGGAGIVLGAISAEGPLLRLAPGLQAGLGLFVPVDSKSILRLDLTRHVYRSNGHSYDVLSFGIGFAGGRRRAG
jgi:hypothetical protein